MFAAILLAFSLITGQLEGGPHNAVFVVWGCFHAAHQQSPLSCGLVRSSPLKPKPGLSGPPTVHVNQRVMRSLMLNHVAPNYPHEAKRKGIQGTVLLNLAVDEKGHASGIKVVSGHPLLAPIAGEAVKRLRFRPFYLNGKAVPIQGYVSYVFQLLPEGKMTVRLGPAR